MDWLKHVLISLVMAGAVIGVVLCADGDEKSPQVGAISSPDFVSPYFSYGGVRHWAAITQMTNASTTCAIQSPTATTTLIAATAQVSLAPTTTPVFEIGNATTAYATTTLLAKHTFTANTLRTIVATTTLTDSGLTDGLISPNTWVNVKQGGGGGSFVPTGTCTAVFRETQ